MSQMNVNVFDLNLVRVFLAIWELRSVTSAADRLGLTQPAVSHSLRRLREQFSDPLFVRVGQRMEPTEAAWRLYDPFNRALRVIQQTILNHDAFVPELSERTFTIAMSDISEFYLLPQLIAHLEVVAPSVRVRSVQLDASTIAGSLRTGQVDLALGYLPALSDAEISSSFLLDDSFVCLVSNRHGAAGLPLGPEGFAQLNFVDVSVHATGYKRVQELLGELGARWTTTTRIEHFTVVPELVRNTNLAAIFPLSAASRIASPGDFSFLELPFDLPSIDVRVHLHANFQNDPGLLWMRDAMSEIFRVSADHMIRDMRLVPAQGS
ncbi:LysR family transcriptional regulator [Xanthobacter agilis]|uniref:DNA-binding transcriptional LysR family regulator n=1 Tax=Xanthobacter agilis TaxID=47492 RepID=A0ABU0LJN2_XANAG|nr:LysR family transcriptional regulator [Xanthobacter agilis]MDQ0507302.1 DNA-binding transcriptional LysR family regulator [Xanthobacter agilis]